MTLISIHTLRVESNLNKNGDLLDTVNISIHTLRVESNVL